MVFVLAAVVTTPLLPFLLKSRCSLCGKRKLEALETFSVQQERQPEYITFHRCNGCDKYFKRHKSGPLEESSFAEYEKLRIEQQSS